MNSVSNISNNNKNEEAAAVQPALVAKDFLTITILLIIIVFLWISFGVYKILTRKEVPEPIRELIRPMEIKFPREVFNDLKQRKNFRNQELNENERVIFKRDDNMPVQPTNESLQ